MIAQKNKTKNNYIAQFKLRVLLLTAPVVYHIQRCLQKNTCYYTHHPITRNLVMRRKDFARGEGLD